MHWEEMIDRFISIRWLMLKFSGQIHLCPWSWVWKFPSAHLGALYKVTGTMNREGLLGKV